MIVRWIVQNDLDTCIENTFDCPSFYTDFLSVHMLNNNMSIYGLNEKV